MQYDSLFLSAVIVNDYDTKISDEFYDYLILKLTMMSLIKLSLPPPQEASNQPFGHLSHFPSSPLQMASLLISRGYSP